MTRVVFLFCLLAPLLLSPDAMARKWRPTETPPAPWRVLGQDEAHSTSRCIGNTVTPLCAVETSIACHLWRKEDLCLLSSTFYDNPEMFEDLKKTFLKYPRTPGKTYWYKIAENRPLTSDESKNVPNPMGIGYGNVQINDGWAISTVSVECLFKENICSTRLARGYFYWLHQEKGKWKIISYRDDRGQVMYKFP